MALDNVHSAYMVIWTLRLLSRDFSVKMGFYPDLAVSATTSFQFSKQLISLLISCSRHRTTKFTNSESLVVLMT